MAKNNCKSVKKMRNDALDMVNESIDNLTKAKEVDDSLLSFFFENESKAYLRMAFSVGLMDSELFNTMLERIKVVLKVGAHGEKQ